MKTFSLDGIPPDVERDVLDAAARGDTIAFLHAAKRLGSLERAQHLVRVRGEHISAHRQPMLAVGLNEGTWN